MKRLGAIFGVCLLLASGSPMFLYWWGLSQLEAIPVPSKIELSSEDELDVWLKEMKGGVPSLRPISAYGYIGYIYCGFRQPLDSNLCDHKYPGLKLSSLAVRNQVASLLDTKVTYKWKLTWFAYTVWVTNNWTIHQVISTYHEEYNT